MENKLQCGITNICWNNKRQNSLTYDRQRNRHKKNGGAQKHHRNKTENNEIPVKYKFVFYHCTLKKHNNNPTETKKTTSPCRHT